MITDLLEYQKMLLKEMKFYRLACFLLATLSVLSFIINYIPNLSFTSQGFINYTHSFELEFENLTEQQIKYSKQIVSEINPDYLSEVKNIIFTENPPFCKDCYGESYPNSRKVYVSWRYGHEEIRNTLCHELLHSFIFTRVTKDYSEPNHRIIRDLSKKDVCYER